MSDVKCTFTITQAIFRQILYDEIGKTWNQNKEIQDHYKDFYIQETQSQSNQFEGQSDVDVSNFF